VKGIFPLLISAALILTLGLPLWWLFRKHHDLGIKDGIFIAAFGWVVVSALSALPFMIHGSIPSFTDAFFEMMSGYTTSGATILTDIEVVPHGLLFWRSQTHLLGGMGFLTLTVIFLPHGMGGPAHLPGGILTGPGDHQREISCPQPGYHGPPVDDLHGVEPGRNHLLCFGGMSLFDSLCHAFGTVSTSGYSPWNASIGHYNNAYFDWIIILFMFLGGMTFVLFYQMIRGDWRALRINTEFRWYVGLMLFFCGMVSWILWKENTYGLMDAIRYGTFQVTSLLTTTGFTTADYEQWPQAAQMFLYAVCFIGACAGSTTSGIKIVHYVVLCKFMSAAIKKIFFQPMSIISVRLNQRPVDDSIIYLSVCYFIVNIFMVLGGGCVMVLTDDMDYVTAMSSVIAALMNIGPGFGAVGPSENYAFISDAGKWFLSYNMLVGRLEMFSALVIFYPLLLEKIT
jgi:trk system potassium uptake protein TrkH